MKGNRIRPHRRHWRMGLVGLLLPLALTSGAQTPLRWNSASQGVQPPQATTLTVGSQTTQPTFATPISQVPAVPLAAGFDVRQFEAIAQELVANQRVPGLALAIVQNGRVLSARGYGITDVRAAEPVDAHTVFRLASLSKSFAGSITGMLVSEGALRWDSKLIDYMPEFRLADPTAAQRLTVADILSHRVGLTHNAYDRDIERDADYRSLLQKLAYAPMKCAPGECYAYQNVAFSTIGDIVFAATGNFYSETVQRRIFKPLGMNDASYGLEGIEASARWARPHVRARGGWVSLTPKPTYYRVPPAAGVNASISDMAQWLLAQTGHRPDVLPAPLLATLHAPLIDTPGELRGSPWRRERVFSAGYALGWRVYDYAGHEVVFHGGAVQGYRGMMALLPERDLGIAILWNSESSLPSGLLPTILDSAIGLPAVAWIDLGPQRPDTMIAGRPAPAAGVDSSTSEAAPD
ncbi:serine hydrolase domain-containing protein [Luteimonas galliterrae]|uniref:serine hydrolase domain-containing protein n=1 Tax=Luteimonas galliterrae TaxID=2940486 RepID=UPI003CE4C8B9